MLWLLHLLVMSIVKETRQVHSIASRRSDFVLMEDMLVSYAKVRKI